MAWVAFAMFACVCATLLAGYPVAFTLGGVALLFALGGLAAGAIDASLLLDLPSRLFGVMSNDTLMAVPLFVFMGVMLERSRIAEQLLESMGALFGRVRGGLGLSVIAVGALLAASTGIVGATVVTMGLLALPTLLKHGYSPRLAAGSICAAGTLGQIIPPSIVLVLLGDVLSSAYQQAQLAQGIFATRTVSVGDLFAGALIPGLLLVAIYMGYVLIVARLRPDAALAGLPGGPVGAMIAVMLVMFLLGFIIDFIEITFVVVPIVAPPLLMMGLDPVWLGVMMAINLQTSFLTPPFGFALFYLRGVASQTLATADIYRGVLPFILAQVGLLVVLAFWPELATWLPGRVFGD